MLKSVNLTLNKSREPIPLYYQLIKEIKQNILSGNLPEGSAIPGELHLAKIYGVSRTTVLKAISELVNEGLLYRVNGKGTFVNKPGQKLSAESIVGVIMPASGHIFGELSSSIIKGLEKHHHHCVLVDFNGRSTSKIESLISINPGMLVIDAMYEFPVRLLEGYAGKIIFINRYSHREEVSASFFLADFLKAGRLAAEHLLSPGIEKIVMSTYKPSPGFMVLRDKISGIKSVLEEQNLPENNLILVNWADIDEITHVLERENKPAAVFADGDSRAGNVYRAAKKLGLKIPEDVSVIGCNDTPWCDIYEPSLSSIAMREDRMAELAVNEIIAHGNTFQRVLIEPELRIRESTIKTS